MSGQADHRLSFIRFRQPISGLIQPVVMHVTCVVFLFVAATTLGCREPARTAGSSSNSPDITKTKPFDLESLIGHWQGVAFQNELGVFQPTQPLSMGRPNRSRPKPVEPLATMKFVLELDKKYLQIKGVESCYITLTYQKPNQPEQIARDLYRLNLTSEPVTFVGKGGVFELESIEKDSLLLRGQFREVAGQWMRNGFQVRLSRSELAQ